ncbi:hypothetical protein AGOR_G00208550 [Albula goreensis]|uniref:Uncharacterized protein n=1 Tax=Albula goreensis TaxID=1534307 RepID=A0A8T3CLD3_9TELE|nr:hypothetical protein AGOR_G00208550 [Albula goreensis]
MSLHSSLWDIAEQQHQSVSGLLLPIGFNFQYVRCQRRECRVRVIWRRRLSGMEQCVKEVQTAVTVLMLMDRTCNAEYFRRQHRSGRDTLIYSSYQAHLPTILTHTPMLHNGAFAIYAHPLIVVAGTRVAFVWWKCGTSGGGCFVE